MGQFLWGIGWGLVAVAILLIASVVIGSTSPPPRVTPAPATPTVATTPVIALIGQAVGLGGWDVTLLDFGPYEKFERRRPATFANGTHVVADMQIQNRQSVQAVLALNDFMLTRDDGQAFPPAPETASIIGGFFVSQSIQPAQTLGIRIVFDIDPNARGLTLTALGTQFRIAEP